MKKVYKDRLLKLAKFLETVPPKRFDMEGWETKRATKPEGKRQGECGFAGCAMGWAAHAKLFPGLTMQYWEYEHGNPIPDAMGEPDYRGARGFDAADELFGLPDEFEDADYYSDPTPSRYLFDPDSYDGKPSPKDVAKRIRAYVKADGQMYAPKKRLLP